MPKINGLEYPRVERGVVVYGPQVQPEPESPAVRVPDAVLEFLNTGTQHDLTNIKGVGKKTAGDIIASREANGPFESLENAAERVGGVSVEQLQAAGVTL